MENIKSKILTEIDKAEKSFRELASFIHANPELGFEERKSSAAVRKVLADSGFKIEDNLCGLNTAFRAEAPNSGGGIKIAFLAEYDALPALGHACGHNLIATAAVAASIAVSRAYEKIPGKVFCIGTPAEEGGGGKIIMARQGVFSGMDAIMMVHPSNRNQCIKKALGVVTVNVKFLGKSAHASAFPESGINALDAMILFFSGINAMRQHIGKHERIHGIITHGGDASNIIPDRTEATLLVRALQEKTIEKNLKRVEDIARGAALATGCTCEFSAIKDLAYAPFHPNRKLAEAFRANMESLGVEDSRASETEGMGSSDIGNVGQVAPTIHPEYSIGGIGVINHTPEFAKTSATDEAVAITLKMAKSMAMTAVDLFERKELVEAVASEFKSENSR